MFDKIGETVEMVLNYHWSGLSGGAEKNGDEFVVTLAPLASENPVAIDMDEIPTGTSKVSWKEAILDLAQKYPPYIPLEKISGKFDQHFGN